MPLSNKVTARVSVAQYLDLPDGHRTTFVVGMLDMIGTAIALIDPGDTWANMLASTDEQNSDEVRQEFDLFSRNDRGDRAVSLCFVNMLAKNADLLPENSSRATTQLRGGMASRFVRWLARSRGSK